MNCHRAMSPFSLKLFFFPLPSLTSAITHLTTNKSSYIKKCICSVPSFVVIYFYLRKLFKDGLGQCEDLSVWSVIFFFTWSTQWVHTIKRYGPEHGWSSVREEKWLAHQCELCTTNITSEYFHSGLMRDAVNIVGDDGAKYELLPSVIIHIDLKTKSATTQCYFFGLTGRNITGEWQVMIRGCWHLFGCKVNVPNCFQVCTYLFNLILKLFSTVECSVTLTLRSASLLLRYLATEMLVLWTFLRRIKSYHSRSYGL